MKIIDLEIAGVLGAPDGHYGFASRGGKPYPLTLVTGKGPSGKSSLLRTIVLAKEVVGSYGAPVSASRVLRTGCARGTLTARWQLDELEQQALTELLREEAREKEPPPTPEVVTTEITSTGTRFDIAATPPVASALGRLYERYSANPTQGKMELFPARRQIQPELWRELPGDLDRVREATLRVSEDPSKYGFVRGMCFDLILAEGTRMQQVLATEGVVVGSDDMDLLAPFKRALGSLSHGLRLSQVRAGKARVTTVWFVRRDGTEVELADLSDSETQAVLLSATFVRQGLNHSLILIDRPELNVHPTDQARFFNAVRALGQDNQIIAATDSREIVESADAHVIELGQ